MTSKIIYNISLLESIITKSNATLIGSYEKLTRDTIINFNCKCNNESQKTFRSINKIGAICKSCTGLLWQEKKKKTLLELYGVENIMKLSEIKDKIRKTNLQKYGVDHPLKNKTVISKLQNTNLKKYGVKHNLQVEKFKEKAKETTLQRYGVESIFKLQETKDKIKSKMLEKYNCEYNLQAKEVRDQIKNTVLEKYGVEHYSQTDDFKEKSKKTCLNKYGVEHYSQTDEYKEKCKETNLTRYGVEFSTQCHEVQEKKQKNAKKYKEYVLPSGTIIKVQGYEPFALDELVKVYQEDDIITARKEIPRITYQVKEKKRYYFPDIYIKSQNKIIEVKSTWTYKSKLDSIQEKAQATKDAGYEYEIWVYDAKGNKTLG